MDGTVLSDFATGVSGFQCLDFDATTGTLYGLWGLGRLAAFNTSGDLIGDSVLTEFSLTSNSGADIAVLSMSTAAVPEPSTFGLLAIGGIAAGVRIRRRRASQAAVDASRESRQDS